MPDEHERNPPANPISERTDRAWLEAQVRELEASGEGLLAQNRQLTQRVHFLRAEIDRLGRIVRVGGVVRNAVRSPGRLRLLRLDLAQALQPRPAPEPNGGGGPADPEVIARLDRSTALEALDRRRRDARMPRPVAALRIGLVADPPLYSLLTGVCEVVPLRPDDGPAAILAGNLDLLLVESAWAGHDGSWRNRLAWLPHPRAFAQTDLAALLAAARTAGVPSAFWATAARHDAGRFAAAARRFDHLFASDDAVLDRLALDRERRWVSAEVLQPGVRVDLHHPAGRPEDLRPLFIGSVPLALPLDRREAIGRLLAVAAARGVLVGDRQAGGDPARFGLPGPAAAGASVRPTTGSIIDLYRRHPVVLLPSFVAKSAVTVPARLLEALASGVPVITTAADAVASLVGDLATASDDAGELEAALTAALAGPEVRDRVRAAAASIAWTHDVRRRLARLARTAGISVEEPGGPVEVLAIVDDPTGFDALVAGLAADGDAVASVIVGTTAWEAARTTLPSAIASAMPGRSVRLVAQRVEDPLAQRYRHLATVASGARIAIVLPAPGGGSARAAAGGLAGLLGCAEASGAAVVALPVPGTGAAHDAVTSVGAFPAVLMRSLVEERGWPAAPAELGRWAAAGVTIHAAAPAIAGDGARS